MDMQTLEKDNVTNSDTTRLNVMFSLFFQGNLWIHLSRISNSTYKMQTEIERTLLYTQSLIFNLNCNPEEASKEFLSDVQKSNKTLEAFNRCQPFFGYIEKTWLHYIAWLAWYNALRSPELQPNVTNEMRINLREHFDLKANAVSKPSLPSNTFFYGVTAF